MQRGITLDLIMLTVVMQDVFLTDCYYADFHNAGFLYDVIALSIDMLSALGSSIWTVKPFWTLLPTLYPQTIPYKRARQDN